VFILALNIYIITLDDLEEYKFIKKGAGICLVNIAFVFSVISVGYLLSGYFINSNMN
jgi:uncharacterized membrane protein YwzB